VSMPLITAPSKMPQLGLWPRTDSLIGKATVKPSFSGDTTPP
jgi:hypothetical protein